MELMEWFGPERTRHNRHGEAKEKVTPPGIAPKVGKDDKQAHYRENKGRDKESSSRTRDVMARMVVSCHKQRRQTLIFHVTLNKLRCNSAPRRDRIDVGGLV